MRVGSSVDPSASAQTIAKLDASANAAAVATKAADSEQFWVIDWVVWSYDGTPTGGKLTIAIGAATVCEVDIVAGGPGALEFPEPLYVAAKTKNEAVTITLAAGGASVTGKVTARIR